MTIVKPPKNEPRVHHPCGKKRRYIADWLEMSETDVLAKFAGLKDAQLVGEGDDSFVFVPGTRDNRILLVAHADTVFDKPVKVSYNGGVFYSSQEGVGIGADDRAGCAMIWLLRSMGHSILITNGEEIGCHGARFLMRDDKWKELINGHQFALEMDRMNANDMAFYDVGSKDFKKWCDENFPGYKGTYGIHTDICELCSPMCGMNISVGYYRQHSDEEHLNEEEWQRTLAAVKKVCALKEIPKFIQDPKPVWTPQANSRSMGYQHEWHRRGREDCAYGDEYQNEEFEPESGRDIVQGKTVSYTGRVDDILVCPWCDAVMDEIEHRQNKKQCLYCHKQF